MNLSTAQSMIVKEYIGLAVSTARRFARYGGDFDELYSECLLALSRAVLTYTPGRGRSLRAWIILLLRQACRRVKGWETVSLGDVDVVERVDDRHERNYETMSSIRGLSLSRLDSETLADWLEGLSTIEAGERRGVCRRTIATRRDELAVKVRMGVAS